MNSPVSVPVIDSGSGREFGRVFEEITGRLVADPGANIESLLQQYPEHANELRELLPVIQVMAEVGHAQPKPSTLNDQRLSEGTLGDFRLGREIGRGGMGVVYEAMQISLRRKVALKVLPFAAMLDPRQLNRFQNEARAAASLHHTNIVPVFSVGCERSVHFYAMQFIEGESLAGIIAELRRREGQGDDRGESKTAIQGSSVKGEAESRDHGASALLNSLSRSLTSGQFVGGAQITPESPTTDWTPGVAPNGKPAVPNDGHTNGASIALPSSDSSARGQRSVDTVRDAQARLSTARSTSDRAFFRTVAKLGIQAAEALDYAHEQGIIHRDIKPANLLLGETGRLWITDFGLARIETDAGMTMTGDLVGTLRYMSPEQALAKRVVVDQRTDIYSLGATLYEMLTLQPAFNGEDRQQLLKQIAFDEPVPLRKINRQIPVELETIALKAIRKNPEERYATAGDLADDLRNFLTNQPIKAKPPTRRERLTKWSRRHPAAVWAAVLVLFTTTIAAATSATLISNAYQREVAERKEANAALSFVVRALRSPDPERDGKTITIAEILDRASKELKDSFSDDPGTNAKLLGAIGESYCGLGLYCEGVPVLERACSLSIAARGPHDLETLDIMIALGRADRESGLLNEAQRLHEEAVTLCRAKLGPFNQNTLASISELAKTYLAMGNSDQAIRLEEATLEQLKDSLGPEDHRTVSMMCALVGCYIESDSRFDEAVKLSERAVALRKANLGPEHLDTVLAMGDLAVCYSNAGRNDEAISLQDKVCKLLKARLGPTDYGVRISMAHLATYFQRAGRIDDYFKLTEETLALQLAKQPDHKETLLLMQSLSHQYSGVGRHDEAISLLQGAVKGANRELRQGHRFTYDLMKTLAGEYRNAFRMEEAISLEEKLLNYCRESLGPDHKITVDEMHSLGMFCMEDRRLDDAIPLGEKAVELRRANYGPDHPKVCESMWNLAMMYRGTGRFDALVSVREDLLKARKATLGTGHHETLWAMIDLAIAYQLVGRDEDARHLADKATKLRDAKFGTKYVEWANATSRLTDYYRTAGRYDDARRTDEEFLELCEAKLGHEDAATTKAMSALAEDYQIAGQLDKAIHFCSEFSNVARRRGSEPAERGLGLRGIAELYRSSGRLNDAIPIFEEVFKSQKASFGPNNMVTLDTMDDLADAYVASNRSAEAEPLARECLRLREQKYADDWKTFKTRSILGGALLAEKKYAEAERLLMAGFEGLRDRAKRIETVDKPCLKEALLRVVQLYDATNQPEKAASWNAKLAEFDKANPGLAKKDIPPAKKTASETEPQPASPAANKSGK